MITENLKPERVFYYFEKISEIPRGSGNEKAVSDYCLSVAEELGLEAFKDEYNNVVIRKGATKGYEDHPGVIIQGHLDMVCEKDKDTVHDFKKDGIKLIKDGDYLRADGTTLGGDDGIAVAMGLALMEADYIAHPALECLFTTDEEAGMGGATGFDASVLKGTRLINIDSEEEGIFVVSCCGGAKAHLEVPMEWEEVPEGLVCIKLKVSGLLGGHSGSDIHLQRASAGKLMGRMLRQAAKTFYFRLSGINGGLMDNAITRECEAELYIPKEDVEEFADMCGQFEQVFNSEYRGSEKNIRISAELGESAGKVMTVKRASDVIYALNLIPSGVQRVSLEMKGLVETSNNLGIIKTTDENVEFVSAVRSSVATIKYDILEKMAMIAELVDGKFFIRSQYPGWEYRPESALRDICIETFKEMYGKAPAVESIHAGLECGLLSSKAPQIDMISIGPDMEGVHTTDEKLSIPSVERTWEFIIEVLKKL